MSWRHYFQTSRLARRAPRSRQLRRRALSHSSDNSTTWKSSNLSPERRRGRKMTRRDFVPKKLNACVSNDRECLMWCGTLLQQMAPYEVVVSPDLIGKLDNVLQSFEITPVQEVNILFRRLFNLICLKVNHAFRFRFSYNQLSQARWRHLCCSQSASRSMLITCASHVLGWCHGARLKWTGTLGLVPTLTKDH